MKKIHYDKTIVLYKMNEWKFKLEGTVQIYFRPQDTLHIWDPVQRVNIFIILVSSAKGETNLDFPNGADGENELTEGVHEGQDEDGAEFTQHRI